jgi:flagellar hook assembly protein FlgD
MILNHLFDPELDDHSSGSIVLPLGPLSNGVHTLRLRAWDMFNNSSEKTLEFFVSDSISVSLLDVFNYPNPFRNETWFTFRHNQFEGDLTATVEVYDFYGKLVQTLESHTISTSGYAMEPIFWDGTSYGGQKLAPGMYLYRMRVGNAKGQFTERVQKLIITD